MLHLIRTDICPSTVSIKNGERVNIEQEFLGLLRRVAAEDGGPGSSTKGDGLIGVDRLVWLLAIEEIAEEF